VNDLAGQSSLSEIIDVKKVFKVFYLGHVVYVFNVFYFPDVFLFLKNVGKV